MGEPAATQALWMLLDEPVLKDAILGHLTWVTGIDLSAVEWFVPESVYPDRARPDLEGMQVIDGETLPRLVVETKFAARLGVDQVDAYLRNQSDRLRGGPGAMVLVVPSARRREAERVVMESLDRLLETGRPLTGIGHAVVTWDEWLNVWVEAAEEASLGARSIAADVAQLQAMCATLCGTFIAPFESTVEPEWHKREEDLRHIVKDASQAVTRPGERLLPARDLGSFWGRWVYTRSPAKESYIGVGLVPQFADGGLGPLWVLVHKEADGFHQMRARLMNSHIGREARHDHGSVWVPLTLPPGTGGVELIEAVIAQVREIIAVITQSSEAIG